MTKRKLVSICVITYNQEHFINETLDSVLEQDYRPLEIIVADDGSKDHTPQILKQYEENNPNIVKVITGGPNLGITGNSNRALKTCNGEYVAFLGGDDLMMPGKISQQVAWLEKDSQRILSAHDVIIIDEKGNNEKYLKCGSMLKTTTNNTINELIRYGNIIVGSSVMLRRSAIPDYGFDERLPIASDWMLWIDSLRNGGTFGILHKPLTKYREHKKGVTKSKRKECFMDGMKTIEIVNKKYPYLGNDIKKCLLRLFMSEVKAMRINIAAIALMRVIKSINI
jgi:glycosyltransferase involved in cell wall biosynthesis